MRWFRPSLRPRDANRDKDTARGRGLSDARGCGRELGRRRIMETVSSSARSMTMKGAPKLQRSSFRADASAPCGSHKHSSETSSIRVTVRFRPLRYAHSKPPRLALMLNSVAARNAQRGILRSGASTSVTTLDAINGGTSRRSTAMIPSLPRTKTIVTSMRRLPETLNCSCGTGGEICDCRLWKRR